MVSKKIFYVFPLAPLGLDSMTPGAQLAGFIKRTFIHCYTQNRKALGLEVSGKKFFVFSQRKFIVAYNFRDRITLNLTLGAWLAGFIQMISIHCYTQNMTALDLVLSEKIFYCIPHDAPGAGPVWTPGARL